MDRYSERHRIILVNSGLTQHQIAKLLGCTQQNVSAWLRQLHEIPPKYWDKIKTLQSDLTKPSL